MSGEVLHHGLSSCPVYAPTMMDVSDSNKELGKYSPANLEDLTEASYRSVPSPGLDDLQHHLVKLNSICMPSLSAWGCDLYLELQRHAQTPSPTSPVLPGEPLLHYSLLTDHPLNHPFL